MSHIAVPSCIDQTRGLKSFGYQMVERMQQLGMLVDVSHLADKGVRDVLRVAKLPIVPVIQMRGFCVSIRVIYLMN